MTSKISKEKEDKQLRNSIIYIIPVTLGGLVPLLTIPIFTRILSPEEYGILALAMIYASFCNGFANLGMTIGFERNFFQYSNNKLKLAQLLFSSLIFVLITFTIISGITYYFKKDISLFLFGETQYDNMIQITFAAHFFTSTATSFYLLYFKNSENATMHSACRTITIISNLIFSIALVVYFEVGVIGIVLARLITSVTLFFVMLHYFMKKMHFSLNKKILFHSLKIGYPLTPKIFIGVLNTQFDKYMIGLLGSIGGVGVYHIGKKVSELIFTFITAIENVFNPQIYQRMFDENGKGRDSIGVYLTPFLYISILSALFLALFSQEIILILTPSSYHKAIPVITILSMYFGFLFFGKIVGIQLIFTEKTHITSLLTIVNVFINVGLNIPFIKKFGVLGAAWATMLSGIISGTISIIVAQNYYKIKYEWNKIFWIIGIFFISSIFLALMIQNETPYHMRLSVKIISIILFLFVGVKYSILTKENFKLIKSVFNFQKS